MLYCTWSSAFPKIESQWTAQTADRVGSWKWQSTVAGKIGDRRMRDGARAHPYGMKTCKGLDHDEFCFPQFRGYIPSAGTILTFWVLDALEHVYVHVSIFMEGRVPCCVDGRKFSLTLSRDYCFHMSHGFVTHCSNGIWVSQHRLHRKSTAWTVVPVFGAVTVLGKHLRLGSLCLSGSHCDAAVQTLLQIHALGLLACTAAPATYPAMVHPVPSFIQQPFCFHEPGAVPGRWRKVGLQLSPQEAFGRVWETAWLSVPAIRGDANPMLLPLHRHWEDKAMCLIKGTL